MFSTTTGWTTPAACILAGLMCANATAQECRAELRDSPIDNRVAVLDNGLVHVEIAPWLGGRMLALGRAGERSLIRNEADYAQTKEAVWTAAGSAGLSGSPARAWISDEAGSTAVARWEHGVDIKGLPLHVTRELGVQTDVPAVFCRVTVRNEGARAARGVGYSLRPHLTRAGNPELLGDTPLSTDELTSPDTNQVVPGLELRIGDVRLLADLKDAAFRIRGERYMFRVEHNLALGDIPAGETRSATGAWWITSGEEAAEKARGFDWEASGELVPVTLLELADMPPADLRKTPIAQGRYWGLCGHSDLDYLPLWQAAGVKFARRGFSWSAAEMRPGEYDFSAMDGTVAAAEQSDIQLLGLISSNPSWATVDGNTISPPKDLRQWERYIETLTRRYRGRVHVWEIWNEPDIGQFWSGTAQDYAALLEAAYRGAKRGNPECLVMSAGLDGPGERFLDEIAKLGALEHCDLVGFHPYAGTPAQAETRMRTVWRILNWYKIRKPVWITEIGWQSGGWKAGPGVVDSEETKARNLTEVYERLRDFAEVVFWYVDREAGAMFGLVRPIDRGLRLNPAYAAFQEGAGKTVADGLRLTGPERVAVDAGKAGRVEWTVKNTTGATLEVRANLNEAQNWARVEVIPARVVPGGEATVRVDLDAPPYIVAGKIPMVLVAWSPDGPTAVATFEFDVTNEAGSCALSLVASWGVRADENWANVGKWTPTSRLVIAPGGRLNQPFQAVNQGSVKETFSLEFTGPAAAWLGKQPETVEIGSGATRWIGAHVTVPPDAEPGVYPLTLTVTSAKYPKVTRTARCNVTVGAPQ